MEADLSPFVVWCSGLIHGRVPTCDHAVQFEVFEPSGSLGTKTLSVRHEDDAPFTQAIDVDRVMRDDVHGHEVMQAFGRAAADYVLNCHSASEFAGARP